MTAYASSTNGKCQTNVVTISEEENSASYYDESVQSADPDRKTITNQRGERHSMWDEDDVGGVWRSGLCLGVRIKGAQVQTPLQSACRCVPGQDTSPQIAPVGIAHSIEYVSRFG